MINLTITPTNCWTTAEKNLAFALASCPALQAYLGVADANAAAAGNMFFDALPFPVNGDSYTEKELRGYMPGIIIGTPGDDSDAYHLSYVASPRMFRPTGSIEVRFQTDLNGDNETIANQERKFKNHVGKIMEEMTDRMDDFYFTDSRVLAYGRARAADTVTAVYIQMAVVEFLWGVGGGDS